jgi:hypothetical protein
VDSRDSGLLTKDGKLFMPFSVKSRQTFAAVSGRQIRFQCMVGAASALILVFSGTH